jgi:hypothetical protein
MVTPEKEPPIISEFQLHKEINKFDIDQLSPIVKTSQINVESNRKFNTNESSSRMLMRKKFNWKKTGGSNTI